MFMHIITVSPSRLSPHYQATGWLDQNPPFFVLFRVIVPSPSSANHHLLLFLLLVVVVVVSSPLFTFRFFHVSDQGLNLTT